MCRDAVNRQVTTEEAEQKSKELNVMFIETSAKAGHNVKTMFRKIAQALPGMDREQEGQGQNQSEFTSFSSSRKNLAIVRCADEDPPDVFR